MASLRLIDATTEYAIGEFSRCLLVVWRGQPTPESFRFRNEKLIDLAGREPNRCALVEIVEDSSKPPSDATRRVAMEVFKELGTKLSGIGFTLEGSAVRVTVTRAILAGMAFFVRSMQPARVFKHATEMAAWVRPLVQPEEPDFEARLLSSLEELRRAIKT